MSKSYMDQQHNIHDNPNLKRNPFKAPEGYLESLDERMTCYGELEKYLLEHECAVGNLALSRRRQFLIRAEREWVLSFLAEYNAATKERSDE